jgi:hypothetical protein
LLLLILPLAGCADDPTQAALQTVTFTATGIDAAQKAALIAYNAGAIKPNSDADKALTAAFTTGRAAIHNANDAVKAGNLTAVNFYVGIATSAASQAQIEITKYAAGTPAAPAALAPVVVPAPAPQQ